MHLSVIIVAVTAVAAVALVDAHFVAVPPPPFHNPPVIIGNDTTDTIPFLVSVQMYNQHICGGTLLNAKVVLTAWHCVRGDQARFAKFFSIVAGTNDLRKGDGVRVRVAKVFRPIDRDYEANDYYRDYAYIVLAEPIKPSSRINFAIVPEAVHYEVGGHVTEYGWGVAVTGGDKTVSVLRRADTFIVERNSVVCQNANMVCLDSRVCRGDSGSPLIFVHDSKPYIVGTANSVSLNSPCVSDGGHYETAWDAYNKIDSETYKDFHANYYDMASSS